MSDEEFVRSVWQYVSVFADSNSCLLDLYPNSDTTMESDFEIERKTRDLAWSAATEFTRNRLEEIRQVEEEIEHLTGKGTHFLTPPMERILARLQSILAGLRSGMKEKTDGN